MPIPNKHERIENAYVSWICNDSVTLFVQRLASRKSMHNSLQWQINIDSVVASWPRG